MGTTLPLSFELIDNIILSLLSNIITERSYKFPQYAKGSAYSALQISIDSSNTLNALYVIIRRYCLIIWNICEIMSSSINPR